MEAQDFSDFFENINPDAPEILSMPSYCDLLRDLQAHAHGYTILKLSLLTTTLRVLPATLRPVITPSLAIHLEGKLQGAYRSWRAFLFGSTFPATRRIYASMQYMFSLCTCVMFYASMLYTFSFVYLCMMFYIRIHKQEGSENAYHRGPSVFCLCGKDDSSLE